MEEQIISSMGNLSQRGLIAGDEKEVFLALPGGLVRIRAGEAELLFEGSCSHLNLREDSLCFVDSRNRILEVSREGTSPYLLSDRTGVRYDEINHMIVQGDYIYYSIYWGGSVYRVAIETGEERFLFHATCLSLALDGEFIYYSDEPTGVIQRMSLEELDHLLSLSKIQLAELWFEENELSQAEIPDFMRRGMADKIDLSLLLEPEVLNDWDGCYSIQPVEGAVLYMACEDDEEEALCYLQALNPETGESAQLLDDPIEAFNLTEDWILFKKADDGCLYRLSYEQGEEKRIMSEEVTDIFVVGDRIWCTHPDEDKITRLYADGSGKEAIRIEK